MAVRSGFEVVCRPKCRPPRRKTAKMGGCGRDPGSWARLLAALTLQCAAKPYWWHGGQPAQVATYRVNVRIKGPRPPPIGLTCASKGPRAKDAFTETEGGLTARRPPDAFHISRDTTETGPRRVPPLVACGGRTVGAEKPPFPQHVVSYNPQCHHCSCNKKSTPEIGCRYFLWS